MAKKTAEERLERAAVQIMRSQQFAAWGGLQFVGKRIIVDDERKCPTAYVDTLGNTYYGRKFIDNLPMDGNNDVHVHFVVLHETGHKALMHLITCERMFKENKDLANEAVDHVVNLLIYELDPTEAFARTLYDTDGNNVFHRNPKYKGWSAKEVYNDLKRNGSKSTGMPVDRHEVFDDYEHDFKKAEEIQEVRKQIEHALRTGSIVAGKGGMNADRLMGALREEQVRWEEHMTEFITSACEGDGNGTWRRPQRRFISDDLYLPTFTEECVGEIVCALDESGSVSQLEHEVCMGQVIGLCRQVRPTKLRLIYWSDGITREEVYLPDQYDDVIRLTKPSGGGGTDVEPVAEYVRKLQDVQCAIVMTDGGIYGGWGDWGDVPTLWCMTRRHVLSPVGKTLYLDLN